MSSSKRKIFVAYIDGTGPRQDEWGNLSQPLFGYWIIKEGTFLDPLAPVKEKVRKPVIFEAKNKITNNLAELRALRALISSLPDEAYCKVYSDSQLVVNSMKGLWKLHEEDLKKEQSEILNLLEKKNITLHLEWIEREKNEFGKILEKINRKAARKRKKFYQRLREAGI